MTILTPAQINILRSRPQQTQLFLSIYQPKTLFAAQVTGSYGQGGNPVSFYNITTGSWTNIYPNVSVRIGETPGGNELGDMRVRSATGTYIDFAENEILWKQGMYLTVIDYINIEAIYPRIVSDPSNPTNVIFYKDYDIPYSNQNTIYGTFPCAGPHRAGFIVTGAWSTYYSSTGTYNVKGDNLTYSWAFEGGTPTGSTAKDPGFVRYTVPGHWKTRLIVTSASGAQDTTYRYASAYQKPSQGTFNPIEAWELEELSGSRGEGGYTARIKIMSILPEIQPHALVVIWAEDSYGGNQGSLGGNSQNNESIVFNGYILDDSIKFNYQQSTMEFSVGSPSDLMKEAEGFSVSCESKASATTWYELTEMTVQKALYHYLRWHSTVLNVNDFQYTGDDRYLQYFDSDRESLFDAVDNFMRNGLLGALVCDRQGKLWAEISHFGLESPFTTIPTNPLNPSKQDWMNDPTIQERRDSDTSFVELGGIAYYGTATNTFSALLANAPGITPLYHGKLERQEGLVLLSQAQLNQVAANYLAYKNAPYPEAVLPINGNYRNIDIAPQEKFFLVIAPSDTIRNVSLQNYPYTPTSMSWRYDSVKQTFIPDLILEQMATGTAVESVLIPATPPYVDSGFDYPSLQLPTLPIFNPSSSVGPTSPVRVIMHDVNIGLVYSEDFDSASPHYRTVNGGLTAGQYQGIDFLTVTPSGAIYVGSRGLNTTGERFFAYAPSIGSSFTVIEDETSIAAKFPGSTITSFVAFEKNPTLSDQVMYVIAGDGGGGSFKSYIGSGAGGFTLASTTGLAIGTGAFGSLTFGLDKWFLTGMTNTAKWYRFSNAGAVEANGFIPGGTSACFYHVRAYTQGRAFLVGDATNVTYTDDNGANFTPQGTGLNSGINDNMIAVEPLGLYGMGRGGGAANKLRTSDGGATWVAIPNLPVGNYRYAYAGGSGSGRWIAAGGSVVRYSPDWGDFWLDKIGNLTGIAPIPNIDLVRAIGV